MKCLIHSVNSTWVGRYFKEIPPPLLKIANKPLLEYMIDFAVLASAKDIRIVLETPSPLIEKYFDDGSNWGVQISYGLARPEDTLSRMLIKNKGFWKESDLLVLDGYFFLEYDRNITEYAFLKAPLTTRRIAGEGGQLMYCSRLELSKDIDAIQYQDYTKLEPEIKLHPLANIQQYYQLNMDTIKYKNKQYVLPGYNSEPDVFLGLNVETASSCRIEKPVMIGNNVQLKKMTLIGPSAIIGDNVIVDESSCIEHSVIYDNTYIGADLEFKKKIIYKNCLISPESGEMVQLTDKYLISKIESNRTPSIFRRFIHIIITCLLLVSGLIPFILIRLVSLLFHGLPPRGDTYFINQNKDLMSLAIYQQPPKGFIRWLEYHLSLDKYPVLFYVLTGRLWLAGNQILPVNPENSRSLEEMSIYLPGVFSYSEMTGNSVNSLARQMDESYYSNHRTWGLDLKIILVSMMNRLFTSRD
jgi:NDP-sugar pyrophosphorylase family protein